MERLTARDSFGTPYYPYCDNVKGCGGYCAQCNFETKTMDKLAEYEDLEEQGLLMRLPCKVGDVLYAVDGNNIQILEAQNDIALVSGELCLFAENERFADYVCYKDIGRTVFFTKAEAEQKLKKIKDK